MFVNSFFFLTIDLLFNFVDGGERVGSKKIFYVHDINGWSLEAGRGPPFSLYIGFHDNKEIKINKFLRKTSQEGFNGNKTSFLFF